MFIAAVLAFASMRVMLPIAAAPAPQIGAINVTHDGICITNHCFALPCAIDAITNLLGAPTELLPAHGDRYSNDTYEWGNLGVYAYSRPGSGQIQSLSVVFTAGTESRRLPNVFSGCVLVRGHCTGGQSLGPALKAAGFARNRSTGWWKQRLGPSSLIAAISATGDHLPELEIDAGTESAP